MRRFALTAAIVALLAGAVVAYANLAGLGGPPHDAAKASKHLRIKGHVTGLFPGGRKVLRATVFNGTQKTVLLRRLRVKVRNAGPGCGKSNLRARGSKRPRTIPPHRRRRVRLPVTMRSQAPDACQGARFPLHFHARFRHPR